MWCRPQIRQYIICQSILNANSMIFSIKNLLYTVYKIQCFIIMWLFVYMYVHVYISYGELTLTKFWNQLLLLSVYFHSWFTLLDHTSIYIAR